MKNVYAEYAKALYDLAIEQGDASRVMQDLHLAVSALCDVPNGLAFLASPAIPLSARLAFLKDTFGSDQGFHPHLLSFLSLLCEKGRVEGLSEIEKEFKSLYDAYYAARKKALVRSAYPLSDGQKQEMCHILSRNLNGQIELDCVIDQAVLGGIYLEIDGMVIDGTLATRLKQAKEVMKQ